MKQVTDLLKYKAQKETYKKIKFVLKELKELDIIMKRQCDQLKSYTKYVPVCEALSIMKEKRIEIIRYIKHYDEVIKKYDDIV